MTATRPRVRRAPMQVPVTSRYLVLCATILALSAPACVRPRAAAAELPAPGQLYEIPLTGAAVRGPKNARVTIVEFSDFQCPYCAQAKTLVDQVLQAYPKDVNFVYKNFPLPMHPNAEPAARAAIAAGKQGKFWEMHDQLFISRDLSPPAIRGIAEKLGLDMRAFDADVASAAVREQVDLEIRQGKWAGVRGTPSFFVNNKIAPARSLATFKAIIDEQLKDKSS